MKDYWIQIMDNFHSYIGTGMVMWIVFLICTIFCFIFERKSEIKISGVIFLLLLVIFNPLLYGIVGNRFLSGIYWRLFWVFPTTIIIAVVLTKLIMHIEKKIVRLLCIGVICVVIAKCGTSVINATTYTGASNDYQLPQYVIEVADRILEDTDGADTKIVASDAITFYIRQYTSRISLGYGRDIYGYINAVQNWEQQLYDLMNADTIDFEGLHELARECGCSYIVFDNTFQALPSDVELRGYQFIAQVDNRYFIYLLE